MKKKTYRGRLEILKSNHKNGKISKSEYIDECNKLKRDRFSKIYEERERLLAEKESEPTAKEPVDEIIEPTDEVDLAVDEDTQNDE